MGGPVVKVTGLDHVVLVADDVERTLQWYLDVLGLEGERVDEWRAEEVLFPSVRVDASTILDIVPRGFGVHAGPAGTNVDHVCLTIEACDLEALAESGAVDAVGPPMDLFGARGTGHSLYVRDPDGNVVELRHY